MANSVDPDHSLGAISSGSALFAKVCLLESRDERVKESYQNKLSNTPTAGCGYSLEVTQCYMVLWKCKSINSFWIKGAPYLALYGYAAVSSVPSVQIWKM